MHEAFEILEFEILKQLKFEKRKFRNWEIEMGSLNALRMEVEIIDIDIFIF